MALALTPLSFLAFAALLLAAASTAAASIGFDYKAALTKSLLFFEAQRSGKLPPDQRITWRGDSALADGYQVNVDLSGGYYDAGDNVKFGFPQAFTITMLSWAAVDFAHYLSINGECNNTLAAIRWGTDYLIKAHPEPELLYGQVGDGNADHACWQRPEEMTSHQPVFKIDAQNPGSDLAAETAAAFAAASIAFRISDGEYAAELLQHAIQLYDFAQTYQGQYQSSIQNAGRFYRSSGYEDELLWTAVWLYRATMSNNYLEYIQSSDTGGVRSEFSWDDKYVGAQILIAKLTGESMFPEEGPWAEAQSDGEAFICSCLQKGDNNVKMSPGGMLWFQPWSNFQYTNSAGFIIAVYADYLLQFEGTLSCLEESVSPSEMIDFAQSQVDYILGKNPNSMSYMVGFGPKYPTKVHHRGASIVSIKTNSTKVECRAGFDLYCRNPAPDPNLLEGAVVGGPDQYDAYTDSRESYSQSEPSTILNPPLVGLLARVA